MMKPVAVAVGLAAVAAAAFLLGRSSPRPYAPPSPATAEKVADEGKAQKDEQRPVTTPRPGPASTPRTEPRLPGLDRPIATSGPVAEPKSIPKFESEELDVTVQKPSSTAWTMTDNPGNFLPKLPNKVLEIRRKPSKRGDTAGIVELFVIDLDGKTPEEARQDVEHLGRRGKTGTLRVLLEDEVEIGGRTFQRRNVLWTRKDEQNYMGKGRDFVLETKLVSLRTVAHGRLYVLIATAFASDFKTLAADLEEVFASLRVE
jgi:hypothetical protein